MVRDRRLSRRGEDAPQNLRVELLAAAEQLLEEGGIAELSLRAVARRAGVSHNAPYHHFRDRAALLAGLAEQGFDRLLSMVQEEQTAAGDANPLGRLLAVGTGYLHFAARHPAVFRLMYRPEWTRPSEHPTLQAAEARTFELLVAAQVACQENGLIPKSDPKFGAVLCWSAVHGLVTLWLDQAFQQTSLAGAKLDDLGGQVLSLCMAGLGVRGGPTSPGGLPHAS